MRLKSVLLWLLFISVKVLLNNISYKWINTKCYKYKDVITVTFKSKVARNKDKLTRTKVGTYVTYLYCLLQTNCDYISQKLSGRSVSSITWLHTKISFYNKHTDTQPQLVLDCANFLIWAQFVPIREDIIRIIIGGWFFRKL